MPNAVRRTTPKGVPRRSTVILSSLLLLVVLGWLDYVTGDYSLIVFYLIPLGLVAWYLNRLYAFLFCILSLITRLVADEAGLSPGLAVSVLHYKNYFAEFLFLVVMGLLVPVLKKQLEKR